MMAYSLTSFGSMIRGLGPYPRPVGEVECASFEASVGTEASLVPILTLFIQIFGQRRNAHSYFYLKPEALGFRGWNEPPPEGSSLNETDINYCDTGGGIWLS